jgi:uracil-DNA glycosylase family 4
MAERLDQAALQQALRAQLDYYRDLGIFDLYRRETDPGGVVYSFAASSAEPAQGLPDRPPSPASSSAPTTLYPEIEEDPDIAPRKAPLPPIAFTPGPLIAPAARAQVLEALRQEIGDCTRCPLGFAGRHTIVFGDGDPNARLLFVGEGPGADEDMQGIPFIGRAGQLLNNMITAMGLKREQVYIANIVKCRPPKNRVPEPVEAITCSQFLLRQIDIVRPEVIVALGSTAATYLLGGKAPLSALRGRIHTAHGAKLIVTYHPAYLLRDPTQKKAAWGDLQLAMKHLQATV